ncbi:hypothetical protein CEXT_211461 [Caerostris extrusa]|uniref:Uncharacterized protein n=1 Tax=Caerostris extrusa TaxID=172846 RepID=A0AAV4QBC1_CAEEX|nr:hypothetical protein CEXT_211461 [Caerostris extrusa]
MLVKTQFQKTTPEETSFICHSENEVEVTELELDVVFANVQISHPETSLMSISIPFIDPSLNTCQVLTRFLTHLSINKQLQVFSTYGGVSSGVEMK